MKEQQVLLGIYISEAINKVLKNSPCTCVYVIWESLNKGKCHVTCQLVK